MVICVGWNDVIIVRKTIKYVRRNLRCRKIYLIWDADTLPISHLEFDDDGRLLFTRKKEYHAEYFITIERLLGLQRVITFSFIAEHMRLKLI